MPFMMKAVIPVESENTAAKVGSLGTTIQSTLEDLKPDSVYFTTSNGRHCSIGGA